MAATLKLATEKPAPRDATGEVKGTIGDHSFKTDIGKWSIHQGIVSMNLIHKHEDGNVAEDVFIQFPSDVEFGKELQLRTHNPPMAWVSYKAEDPVLVAQCISSRSGDPENKPGKAILVIEKLSLSPFEVTGKLQSTTNEIRIEYVTLNFHLKQSN
ncbi:hypothetical protein A7J50_2591 [Pseudomonas antarctica]|uniref:Uncharacterized protein n=1 Tax=Pseudomonas antarctica TaxID=219572 RepID=A0A172Z0M9_9PSED|nr:hypothetical protein [Pseudomonas antarctica]ANF85990.1 hypothetical protein A7J50_2591 [Pseudomonas antarctica]